jgi:hypothetical protein
MNGFFSGNFFILSLGYAVEGLIFPWMITSMLWEGLHALIG